jgi:hypothetical protein
MKRIAIFRKLRADHARVLRDLDAVGRGTSVAPRRGGRRRSGAAPRLRALLGRLGRQFASHMAAEDERLFPALESALPEARPGIEPLRVEHVELRALLTSLTELVDQPPGRERDERFRVQWSDFTELLRLHIRKEEALVFHVAEQVLPPRELARIEARRFPRRTQARARTQSRSGKESRS